MFTVRITVNAGHDLTHIEFTFIAASAADAWAMASHAMDQLGFKPGDYRIPQVAPA